MTPSLPTFCIAFGDHLADLGVAVGRDGADLGDFVDEVDLLGALLEVLDDGLRPRCRCRASGPSGSCRRRPTWRLRCTIAWASTVAVVVPSPAMSLVFEATSRTICAPMFSNLSSSSISLATVTPSLVMRGAPKRLVDARRCGPWGRASPSRRWRECRRRAACGRARRRRILRPWLPLLTVLLEL